MVETDMFTSIAASLLDDIIVFIGNVIMCLIAHCDLPDNFQYRSVRSKEKSSNNR
jgi:hypothetical protein